MPVNRVEGDNAANLIDENFLDDAEGDRIDNNDAPDGSNDDVVEGFGGNDTIFSGEGDDTVYAGSGDDFVDGGPANDLIFGDSGNPDATGGSGGREVFQWSLAPDPNDADPIEGGDPITEFIQNTGTVDVRFFVFQATGPVENTFADNTQNVDGVVTDGSPANPESSLSSVLDGKARTDLKLQFSSDVTDVSFQINDLDGSERVQIFAFDADDNLLPVTFTSGSAVTVVSPEEAVGSGIGTDDNPDNSLGVLIAGPVSQLIIRYNSPEGVTDGINVTDVYFNTGGGIVDDGEPGNDTLIGGEGDDTIFGEEGDDLILGGTGDDLLDGGSGDDFIQGGTGADTLRGGDGDDTLIGGGEGGNVISGGAGQDLIIGGAPGDVVDGGSTGVDNDTLDLRNSGPLRLVDVTDDPDGNSISGRIEFFGTNGEITGELVFTEIENLLLPENNTPILNPDNATTDVGTPVTIDVLANDVDPDGDALTVTSVGDPANGTATVNPDGTIGYSPDPGFTGTDTFTYTVDDGNGGVATSTVTINVGFENTPPITNPNTAETDEDTPVTIDVLANDSDPDGDPLTVTEATAENGTVTINPEGTITYTPNPDFNGTDTITYTADDGNGGATPGTVTVTINPVNDAPVAANDSATTDVDSAVDINVLGNDFDVDGDTLTVTSATPGTNGTTAINPDGTITYTPEAGFVGLDTFEYTVDDGNGGTDTATVTVSVGGVPLPRDGIVDGTPGDDLIDLNYTGDPDGDFVDAGDALLPGAAPDDDFIRAGDGNDTVLAGLGDDLVVAGRGNDFVNGGEGDDTIFGEEGNDTLLGDVGDDLIDGGPGNDLIFGGAGDDTITGGEGADTLFGGDDRDTFVGITPGDLIFGGAGGNDFDTLDLRGSGPLRIVDVVLDEDGNGIDGTVEFLNDDRTEVTGRATFTNIEEVIPCFTPGTLIATPRGEVPVEDLREGDRVITRDNGLQEIRWTGARSLGAGDLLATPKLRPVLIRAGSLGHGLPERDMLVSPQHRLLLTSERAALYFGEREVLAAAKHLTGMEGIDEVQASGVTYIHFMCDRHEVVLSDGAWTESFQPGEQVMDGMGETVREEIYSLFPELRDKAGIEAYQAARRSLKRHEARLLVE